jgi:lipopolysaccharide transport system ATP-binding protein
MSIAIKVENLSKMYQLGEIGTGTISRDVERWYKTKVLGKEDPFLKIGEANDRATKGNNDFVYSLKDINFAINQGDAVGIIGRNGAGKSTLLKVLSQVTSPTTGSIKVKGRIASLLEVGTGFHPELTGKENIFLNGAILGMRKAEIKKKFDEIVDFSGCERYIDTPVKRYSSGMYVRLAFAVAAHLESEILIVDEVLAVGDAEFQKKCLGKMNEVSKGEGRTVLFVSHNMGSIAQLCNKGILLNNGKVEYDGKVNDVVNTYITENSFSSEAYIIDEAKIKNKLNYFSKIYLHNIENKPTSDFSFNESVYLNIEAVIKNKVQNIQIGIGIQDKQNNRITSFLKPIEELQNLGDNLYKGILQLPASILAPNAFTFTIALWIKDVEIFDMLENVCAFKIHDNGTEFSNLEGIDYGSVILNNNWIN